MKLQLRLDLNTERFCRPAAGLLLAVAAGVVSAPAAAQTAAWTEPTFDRWNYPFNSPPGTTATVSRDLTSTYDPPPDPWQARLDPADPEFIADTDPADAIVLSGTDFRNGFTLSSYGETGLYSPTGAFGVDIRNAYSAAFDAGGSLIDISNNVRDRFEPAIWAVGLTIAVSPGADVPIDATFTFEVDLTEPFVLGYIQDALDAGLLGFTISSKLGTFQQSAEVPAFYTKEEDNVPAVSLAIEFGVAPCSPAEVTTDGEGDAPPDGRVTLSDFSAYLSRWATNDPRADITLTGVCDVVAGGGDGVDLSDFSCYLATWSQGCP